MDIKCISTETMKMIYADLDDWYKVLSSKLKDSFDLSWESDRVLRCQLHSELLSEDMYIEREEALSLVYDFEDVYTSDYDILLDVDEEEGTAVFDFSYCAFVLREGNLLRVHGNCYSGFTESELKEIVNTLLKNYLNSKDAHINGSENIKIFSGSKYIRYSLFCESEDVAVDLSDDFWGFLNGEGGIERISDEYLAELSKESPMYKKSFYALKAKKELGESFTKILPYFEMHLGWDFFNTYAVVLDDGTYVLRGYLVLE